MSKKGKGKPKSKEVFREKENDDEGRLSSISISASGLIDRSNAYEKKIQNGKKSQADCVKHARRVSKLKIVWCFISFLISILDVTVIIYLSYLHFHHNSDVSAWLTLLPILLNFVGVYTFLSDDDERKEMQELGCERLKNLMFFPVIGPSVSALKLFIYALEEKKIERFERFESLLTRMKQYESFFRAAPEVFVQLTFRIISWSQLKHIYAEDYWTSLCIGLSLYALAESNMYGPVLPYYHLFQRIKTKDAWRIDQIGIFWRIGLFFFTYLSIGSRIFADSILKATACFYFEDRSFGEVLIISFLFQFFLRAGIYGCYNWSLGTMDQQKKMSDEGVYGAFTYSWKSLFMCFDYESWSNLVFYWFYMESFLMISISYIVVYAATDVDLTDKVLYHIYSGQSLVGIIVAISLNAFLRNKWRKENRNKVLVLEVP